MQDDANKHDGEMPRIRPISAPMDVPVFNVVIYVSQRDGKVQARVANLPDIEFSEIREPVAFNQTITHVKKQLAEWHGAGTTIPWIDPVPAATDDEQERLVPVHL